MIPGSLAHCLKPPYVVGKERAAEISGLSAYRASQGFVLVRGGSQASPIEREHAKALDTALRSKLGAGYAGPARARHCGRDAAIPLPPERCMGIQVHLCTGTVSAIADAFRDALDRTGLRGASVGLEVIRFGVAGPRCEPSDPTCLPDPYASPTDQGALPYDASLPRRVVQRKHARASGRCAHDGHCIAQAEQCFAWFEPVAPVPSRSRRIEMLDDQCGCVANECAWFEPARPGVAVAATLEAEAWSDTSGETEESPPRRRLEEVLTGARVKRALRACYRGHMKVLPRTFRVEVNVDAAGAPTTTRVEVEGKPHGQLDCVKAALGAPGALPPPSTGKAARFTATITVSEQ